MMDCKWHPAQCVSSHCVTDNSNALVQIMLAPTQDKAEGTCTGIRLFKSGCAATLVSVLRLTA